MPEPRRARTRAPAPLAQCSTSSSHVAPPSPCCLHRHRNPNASAPRPTQALRIRAPRVNRRLIVDTQPSAKVATWLGPAVALRASAKIFAPVAEPGGWIGWGPSGPGRRTTGGRSEWKRSLAELRAAQAPGGGRRQVRLGGPASTNQPVGAGAAAGPVGVRRALLRLDLKSCYENNPG
jgi:hypothetical protein